MTSEHSPYMKDLMRTDRQSLQAELEKAGAVFKGNECTCPWHSDQHPSAGIFQDSMGVWRFKCHAASCGKKGDYWDIRSKNENKTLAQLFAETTPKPDSPPPVKKIHNSIDEAAKAITDQIQARYQYTNPTSGKIELVIFRIMTANGKSFPQLSPEGTGWVFKGPPKPWPLYNRKRILKSETVICVEGESCVHALQERDFVATTSPGGAANAGQADWQPLAGKNIILWPDNDEAGRKYMQQVQAILEHLKPAPQVSILEPLELELEAKEDVVDFIKQLEVLGYETDKIKTELQQVIGKAKPTGIAAEVGKRIAATIAGTWAAVDLPWQSLNRLTRPLLPACISLFVGSVGHGKSFMLLQCLADFHRRGYKTACFELEEDRTYHLSRVLAQRAGLPDLVDPDWVRANGELAQNKYIEHKDFLDSFGGAIWATPERQQTLGEIAEWIAARAQDGCRVVAVDPITAAVATDKSWIADNEFLAKIKHTATDSGCSIILITHPTKAFNRPDVNQLAGGAAYSRFAQSIVWLLAHEQKESKIKGLMGTAFTQHNRTVMILKARNGAGGGMSLAYEFDRENLKLNELGLIIKD